MNRYIFISWDESMWVSIQDSSSIFGLGTRETGTFEKDRYDLLLLDLTEAFLQ